MDISVAQTIHGWMSDEELRFLAQHAQKCRIILEAGCYKGRSTRAMADNTNGTVFAIDPWNGDYGDGYDNPRDNAYQSYKTNPEEILKEFKRNLEPHVTTGKVICIPKPFSKFWAFRPDMIFIDACHGYEHVKDDIYHALQMVPAFLCGHDYSGNWPGVIQAVDEIFGKQISVTDAIWWIKL